MSEFVWLCAFEWYLRYADNLYAEDENKPWPRAYPALLLQIADKDDYFGCISWKIIELTVYSDDAETRARLAEIKARNNVF